MEENELLVKVEGVSKKFCKDLKRSLWYGVQDLNPFKPPSNSSELRKDEFWAVKDVSFELRRGECLGLIGHNGAGKSTLLKMLNGLINPDEGKITIKGRIGALIELGAGFNPILSGRENIYNNGAVLGFTKEEIDAKVEEIIDFAEIRDFIDMPVQNYSSGMRVRLGFAVAAQMEPDVLIIDEVLAVGDLGFVLKCFKTIDQMLPNTAIVFVSHSMPMISRICNQIILMERGKSKLQDKDVSKAIDLYYSKFSNNETNVVFSDNSLKLNYCEIVTKSKKVNGYEINWGDRFKLKISFNVLSPLVELEYFVIIVDKEQRPIASFVQNTSNDFIKIINNKIEFNLIHEDLQLSKGLYSINLAVRKLRSKEPVYRVNNVSSFQVIFGEETWEPFLLRSKYENLK